MKKAKKAKLPIKKIIGICLILLFVMGVGVMADNAKLVNVKIILSNGYIMNVTTSKNKVADILEENHIILLPEESVIPEKESNISDNKTIKISKDEKQVEVAQTEENSSNITVETLLKSYDSIVEKIETVQETIPYETITKDVSDNASNKRETVVQQGKDGLREVTYKVKYQNDAEIERTEISSNIIEEPVDKIIEVRKKTITNRSTRSSSVTYNNGVWSYSAEEFDLLCAITAQECSSSYEGALAVITTACNRAESSKWGSKGSDPLSQYKAPGQFCYSIDSHWKKRLNGNYSSVVTKAVSDALNGKRNHNYLSFRAAGHASGEYIGGNVYF